MKVVIVAGGRGTRLRPLTNDRPKPMVEVAGKPIIEWEITWLKSYGIKSFLVLGSYMLNVLQDYVGDGSKWGVNVEYFDEGEPRGTGGALYGAKDLLKNDDDFFMVNGDTITDFDIRKAKRGEYLATIVISPLRSPYGIVDLDGEKITKFEEKPLIEGYWINAGMFYMKKEIFNYLPKKGDISFETWPKIAAEGKLGSVKSTAYLKMIDALKDVDETNADIEKGVFKPLQ